MSEAQKPEDKKQGQSDKECAGMDCPLPEINFSTFIFSLNSSVYLHLGLIGDPNTGQKTRNLDMAKQTIDIMVMLEEKTRGNLTKDEGTMIESMLYDLRVLYVKEKK